jgi:hypothetical protein
MKTTVNKMYLKLLINNPELQKEFEQFIYKITEDKVLNKHLQLVGELKEFDLPEEQELYNLYMSGVEDVQTKADKKPYEDLIKKTRKNLQKIYKV